MVPHSGQQTPNPKTLTMKPLFRNNTLRWLLLGWLALWSFLPFGCKENKAKPSSPLSKKASQIINLENNWLGAFKIADTVALKNLLTDDFQLTLETGQHYHRAALFAALGANTWGISTYQQRTSDLEIAFFNQYTAVLSGVLIRDFLEENGQTTLRLRFTDTYIRQRGKWKLAASHLSRLEF